MTDEPLRSNRFGSTLVLHLGEAYDSLNDDVLEQVEASLLSCTDQPETRNLVVDMSGTAFFGSRFIEALFRAYNRMKRKGGRFALAALQPYPEDVIRISKLDTVWLLFRSVDEAVRYFEESPGSPGT